MYLTNNFWTIDFFMVQSIMRMATYVYFLHFQKIKRMKETFPSPSMTPEIVALSREERYYCFRRGALSSFHLRMASSFWHMGRRAHSSSIFSPPPSPTLHLQDHFSSKFQSINQSINQ